MLLTIVSWFFAVVFIVAAVVFLLVLATEIFVLADYSYRRELYSVAVEVRLFRRWRLYGKDWAGAEAREVIENSAGEIAAEIRPDIAETIRETAPVAKTVPKTEELTATVAGQSFELPIEQYCEPVIIADAGKPPTDNGPAAARRTASEAGRETVAESARNKSGGGDRLRVALKSELRANPGRNVILLFRLLRDLKRLIVYIVTSCYKSFIIKKMDADCRFGAEDPFDTGRVAGVVYTALNSCNYIRRHKKICIRFTPDFEQPLFEFDGNAIIIIKATTAVVKIIGAVICAIAKGVIWYGGKIAWRLGTNYFGKSEKPDIN